MGYKKDTSFETYYESVGEGWPRKGSRWTCMASFEQHQLNAEVGLGVSVVYTLNGILVGNSHTSAYSILGKLDEGPWSGQPNSCRAIGQKDTPALAT